MFRQSRRVIAALIIVLPFAALPAQATTDAVPASRASAVALAGETAQTSDVAPAGETARTSEVAPAGGPRFADARVGVETNVDANVTDDLLQDNPTTRRGVRHMVVGGAAIIVGGLIGDDAGTIVSIGGAALLIYGVYLYLQGS